MPTHHTCHACGYPLTRLRAAADPHYNLPIVTCPECATSVVRRPDPGVRGYRTACKAARAVIAAGIQLLVAVLVFFASVGLIGRLAFSAREDYNANPLVVLLTQPHLLRQDQIGPDLAITAILLAFLGIFVGAWIRSALSHLNPWITWIIAVAVPLGYILHYALLYLVWIRFIKSDTNPYNAWGDAQTFAAINEILTAGMMYAVFIAIGFPFARSIRSLWASQKSARWKRRRRARRRLRDDR